MLMPRTGWVIDCAICARWINSVSACAGSKADSLYMTEDAFAKATGTKDKELFLIEGATHIETYWVPEYVDATLAKLGLFFTRTP